MDERQKEKEVIKSLEELDDYSKNPSVWEIIKKEFTLSTIVIDYPHPLLFRVFEKIYKEKIKKKLQ